MGNTFSFKNFFTKRTRIMERHPYKTPIFVRSTDWTGTRKTSGTKKTIKIKEIVIITSIVFFLFTLLKSILKVHHLSRFFS